MSDQKSLIHIVHRMPGDAPMSAAVADELHTIVTAAARPVRAGESIKTQMNRAWAALGRPPMWRLRSAWWRDGSGSWSAAAVRDFQARYLAHLDREARRAEQAALIEGATRSTTDEPEYVQLARADYQELVQRILAIEEAIRIRT